MKRPIRSWRYFLNTSSTSAKIDWKSIKPTKSNIPELTCPYPLVLTHRSLITWPCAFFSPFRMLTLFRHKTHNILHWKTLIFFFSLPRVLPMGLLSTVFKPSVNTQLLIPSWASLLCSSPQNLSTSQNINAFSLPLRWRGRTRFAQAHESKTD